LDSIRRFLLATSSLVWRRVAPCKCLFSPSNAMHNGGIRLAYFFICGIANNAMLALEQVQSVFGVHVVDCVVGKAAEITPFPPTAGTLLEF
jgi:hypothetical protein